MSFLHNQTFMSVSCSELSTRHCDVPLRRQDCPNLGNYYSSVSCSELSTRRYKMCPCADKIVNLFTRIVNHVCCVCFQTNVSLLVLWNFCYDFIDALLQLIDFGTDIYWDGPLNWDKGCFSNIALLLRML